MKLSVFVRMGHKPIVVEVHGGPSTQMDAAGAGGSSSEEERWNGERYASIVQEHLLGGRGSTVRALRSGEVRLVHDHDSAHTSRLFSQFAEKNGIDVFLLPAKGADLDPLDYGVFGCLKQQWERRVLEERLAWKQQCQLFIHMLEAFDPTACIAALPHRIQLCIAAHGWHFES